jgi:glycosyltransferase involved in cell wall biosynthesis
MGIFIEPGKTGLKFTYNDANSLVQKIRKFESMDTKRLVESAVRKYIEEYTPDRNYSKLNDVYKKSNQGVFPSQRKDF